MKYKYNPGDMFLLESQKWEKGNFVDELIIIVETPKDLLRRYRVFNQTFHMFMERKEAFLEKFYTKVA